jgi:S-(hydroxymethyl)glutathione dehydrogenase/alcohol dehydrogenase
MKAAVCYEYGQPLVIEDIDIDPPQTGEVKVKLAATAICHSDIHLIHGEFGGSVPLVAGHEAAGIIEEVGEGVTMVKVGDKVVVSLLRSCGRCHSCLMGAPNNCEAQWALETGSRLHNKQGQSLRHGTRVGAFAEYCIVDQSQVVVIAEDIGFEQASLLACGVITGVGAVINTAQVKPGSAAVIVGCGGVGLNAVQGASLAGAYPIIAVDVLDPKLDVARTFGATHTINSTQEKLRDAVRKLTGGRGAEYVFVTVGNPKALEQSFPLVCKQGTIVIVGLAGNVPITLPVSNLIWNESRILTSWMGSARLKIDVPRLATLYREGKLKLDELITARYSLDDINEAIDVLAKGQALRNVIVF